MYINYLRSISAVVIIYSNFECGLTFPCYEYNSKNELNLKRYMYHPNFVTAPFE